MPSANESTEQERRTSDRRSRGTGPFGALRGWQRRRRGRRTEDRNFYVDVFSRRDVALLCLIFGLNLLDAGFTLLYLSQGGSEGNPAMAHLLDISPTVFLLQKCFVVGLWLVFLIVHKNFRFARIGLRMLLGLYLGVFVYHLVLQTTI